MLGNAKKDNAFGSTYYFHSLLMDLIWGPGINLSILIVLYSYRNYYVYAHSIFGLFATIFTIATSLPILLKTGIISTAPSGVNDSGSIIYAHYIVGIIAISSIFLVAILGIATKLMNILQASSSSIMLVRNAHRILGYLIAILAKSNIYIIYSPTKSDFWLYLVQDLFFVAVILGRKIKFPKMEEVIIPNKSFLSSCLKLSKKHN
jgi:hypothetical protein